MRLNEITVAVGRQWLSKNSIENRFFERILEGFFFDKEMLITQEIMVAANFRLQYRDQRDTLHKICNFEPFLKFEISCGSPFARLRFVPLFRYYKSSVWPCGVMQVGEWGESRIIKGLQSFHSSCHSDRTFLLVVLLSICHIVDGVRLRARQMSSWRA